MNPSSQGMTHGTDEGPGNLPVGTVRLPSWAPLEVLGT